MKMKNTITKTQISELVILLQEELNGKFHGLKDGTDFGQYFMNGYVYNDNTEVEFMITEDEVSIHPVIRTTSTSIYTYGKDMSSFDTIRGQILEMTSILNSTVTC